MAYSEPLIDRSPEVFPVLEEPVRYVEVVSAVVSSLKEDAAYENHEQGHTWKFTYGTAEVFVHLSGESPEDTLLVWSPVLSLPVAEPAKLMQKLLEKNWSDTLEARFCIWNNQVVLNHYRTLEGISAGEISRAVTIVASLADEYDEPLRAEFPPLEMGSQGAWLPYRVAPGGWQMEQDAWLLQRLRHAPRPCLRFYGWDRLTLSLGRHQAWPDSAPGIPVVRRPTGGRAVLHQAAEEAAELTYSLVLPLSYLQRRLPRLQRACVYDFCCRFWVEGLAALGIAVDPRVSAHDRPAGQNRLTPDPGYHNKVSCFAARTRADLSWQGKKLMGNAQLWQPWGILQQGSLLLRPNFELWERYLPGSQVIGVYDLCPTAPGIPALMEHFLQMAQECFEVEWQEETWPDPLHWEDPAGIADPE